MYYSVVKIGFINNKGSVMLCSFLWRAVQCDGVVHNETAVKWPFSQNKWNPHVQTKLEAMLGEQLRDRGSLQSTVQRVTLYYLTCKNCLICILEYSTIPKQWNCTSVSVWQGAHEHVWERALGGWYLALCMHCGPVTVQMNNWTEVCGCKLTVSESDIITSQRAQPVNVMAANML